MVVKELEEPSELALNIAEPLVMRLCIITQDVDLDEVVEALEKFHLLKEFCPLVLGLKLCLGLLLLVLLLL